MRINQFVAQATGLSRRAIDVAIKNNEVYINDRIAEIGQDVSLNDKLVFRGRSISLPTKNITIIFNKPVGYVCSRNGQGSLTIYDLLPEQFHGLKPVGRLDKDSSGLLLLTNDGQLAFTLTHPKFNKAKIYEIKLNRPLNDTDKVSIEGGRVIIDGKKSILKLTKLSDNDLDWQVSLHEGRNRQIRRTFEALNYQVNQLRRIQFGDYKLNNLAESSYQVLE